MHIAQLCNYTNLAQSGEIFLLGKIACVSILTADPQKQLLISVCNVVPVQGPASHVVLSLWSCLVQKWKVPLVCVFV